MIEEAVQQIRQLTPDPAADYRRDDGRPILPDAVAKALPGGQFAVETREFMSLKIDPGFEMLLDSDDTDARSYAAGRLEEARCLLKAIEYRGTTLQRVAQVMVNRQAAFVRDGRSSLGTLTLDEVAEAVGLSRTTVWRAVQEKWIELPGGLFRLKELLCRPSITVNGKPVANDSVKTALRELIDSEDRGRPYSDSDLAAELSGRGLPVARRTVAKYRQSMGIDGARQRRRIVPC